jgi:hypothetical protein
MHLRVGSKGVARLGLIALLFGLVAACGGRDAVRDVRVALVVDPVKPAVDTDTTVRVTLADGRGPLPGARVQVEAHMSHPGMAPIVVDASETEAGSYTARIPFSMAGEWTLVATGALPDGRRITSDLQHTDVVSGGPGPSAVEGSRTEGRPEP